jgi:hypothetical protein
MSSLLSFKKKAETPQPEQPEAVLSPWDKIKRIIGGIVTWLYRLRGLFLAIPVVYAAVKIAEYNMANLPQVVGINLQASGAFADTITREFAVYGPFGLTCACLILMLCSRKVMYPWAISILTLILPFLLLLSNRYPC